MKSPLNRTAVALASLLLAFSLAGCGKSNQPVNNSNPVDDNKIEDSNLSNENKPSENTPSESAPTPTTDNPLDIASLAEAFIGNWQMISSECEGDYEDLNGKNAIYNLTIRKANGNFEIEYSSSSAYATDIAQINEYQLVNDLMYFGDNQCADFFLSFSGEHTSTDLIEGTSITYTDCTANICINGEDTDLLTMVGDFGGGVFKKIPDNSISDVATVKNNGSYFLEIDDKVFYRSYGDYTLGSALFGNFMGAPMQDSVTTMHCYNLTEGIDSLSFVDYGFGKIYYHDGYFYSNKITEDSKIVYRVDEHGENYTEIGEGIIIGLDETSGTIAITGNVDHRYYSFYKDGEELYTIFPQENESLELITVDQNLAIFVGYTYSIDYTYVYGTYYSLDLSHRPEDDQFNSEVSEDDTCYPLKVLGTLQCLDELDGFPEIEDAIIYDNMVYISESYYGGTGHFLYDDRLITVDLSGETDPKVELSLYLGLDADELAPIYLYINHNYVDYTIGSTHGLSATDLYSNYPNDIDADFTIVEYEEYVDGNLFAIVDTAKRDPDNDVGWRENYVRTATKYIMLDSDGNATEMSDITLVMVE